MWKLKVVLSTKLSSQKKLAITFLAKAFPSIFAVNGMVNEVE